ncbi:MAG: amino acid permease [Chlamydiae bacterium]|nr:amino acid permease [Chlamydiota bacterium]
MHPKKSFQSILSGTLLIAGTTVGAGMLGIPLVTGEAGFAPAMLITVLAWAFMLCTGLLLLEVSLWMPEGSNILSMSKRFLGSKGKWFAGSMFVFLYYCLMVAYFAAGAPLLMGFLEEITGIAIQGTASYFLFGAFFAVIVAHGVKSIDRVNIILVVSMVIAYFLLLGAGSKEVSFSKLQPSHFSKMFISVPILFSAFGFHNVIPPLCTYLKKDRKSLQLAIVFGTTLPLLVYILWQWLVIGSVPSEMIKQTLEQGGTAAQALEHIVGNPWVSKLAKFFAFFAIITSLLGVAFSMVDFLQDAWKDTVIRSKRTFLSIVTFFPPFLFVCLDATLFDKALSLAGGFGESILNGLLPVSLVWVGRYKKRLESESPLPGGKTLLIFLYVLSLSVIVLEVFQLFFGF